MVKSSNYRYVNQSTGMPQLIPAGNNITVQYRIHKNLDICIKPFSGDPLELKLVISTIEDLALTEDQIDKYTLATARQFILHKEKIFS